MTSRSVDTLGVIQGACTRYRKSLTSVIIVILVVSYQWESIKVNSSLPTAMTRRHRPSLEIELEPCIERQVRKWNHGPLRPLVLLNASKPSLGGSRSKPLQSFYQKEGEIERPSQEVSMPEQPSLAVVGAKDVMVDIRQMEMMIRGEILPLPISSKSSRVMDEVVAIDIHGGTIRTASKIVQNKNDGSGCVVREEHWYAHRRYPGLIVRDVLFTNTLHAPVTIEMATQSLPNDFIKPKNITFDPRKLVVLQRQGGGDSETGKPLVIVYTKTKSNFTLQPRMSVRRLLLMQAVLPDPGTQTLSFDAVDNAIEVITSAASPTALLKLHELEWGSLWPLQVRTSDANSMQMWSVQLSSALSAFYYLLSALELERYGGDEHPSDGGCYVGTILRLASQMPEHPQKLGELTDYVHKWAHILRQGGCHIADSDGRLQPFQIVTAVAFGLFGVHVNPGGKTLYIADSTDLPPGLSVTVGPIGFNDHKIELSLTDKQITMLRQDALSEMLYTSSFRGALEEFAPHQKKMLPPHGVLISSEVHDLELHWASGELDHGQHEDHNAQSNHTSYSGVLVGVLTLAVVCFHCFLLILLYRSELCAGSNADFLPTFQRSLKFRKSSVPVPRDSGRVVRA